MEIPYKYYSTICLMIKDEGEYLREWIDYHLILGIDHFYITDNNSNPPLKDMIQDYIDSGLVSYRYDTRIRPQKLVYNECIENNQREARWIGFFDTDEFVVLKKDTNIRDFLKRYEQYGSVIIFWYRFGSNGHQQKQPLVIQSYTRREAISTHFKSFVQPKYVIKYDVHSVTDHIPGYSWVNERGQTTGNPYKTTIRPTELSQLNHYILRSQEDFFEKLRRGGGVHASFHKYEEFNQINLRSTIIDRSIFDLINRIRQRFPNNSWIRDFCSRYSPPQEDSKPPVLIPILTPTLPTLSNQPIDFDWTLYRLLYPDLYRAFKNRDQCSRHYRNHGCRENRIFSISEFYRQYPNFNWKEWANSHPDAQLKNERDTIIYYFKNRK